MGRGHEHAHRLHVGETSQRETFVLHPVLGTDHRRARRCASSELDEELLAVLGLGSENGDVAVSEAGRRRARGRRDPELDGAVGVAQLEPSLVSAAWWAPRATRTTSWP